LKEGDEETISANDKKPKNPAEDADALLLATVGDNFLRDLALSFSLKNFAFKDLKSNIQIKQLNQTSTNILEKLNKTAFKLETILKRLANFEKLFNEAPKTKDQKHPVKVANQTDSIEEHDNVTDLLLS
jgi:hypothetical protein